MGQGSGARDVGARSRDPRTVFAAWLRATPALDRIDFVNTLYEMDGRPRFVNGIAVLRQWNEFTGAVSTVKRAI